MGFLPNKEFELIKCLLGDGLKILYRSGALYTNNKKDVSNTLSGIYKYQLVHSTTSVIKYKYASRNNVGHFGVSKVIFSESGMQNIIIDFNGDFGMTENALGIQIENNTDGENIKKAMNSNKFKLLLSSCMWSNFRIDWRLFTYFKKDFWKEFV